MAQPNTNTPTANSDAPVAPSGEVEIEPSAESFPSSSVRIIGPVIALLSREEWQLVGMMLAVKAVFFWWGTRSFRVWMNQPTVGVLGWLEMWNRWDAPHYLSLAELGYTGVGERRFMLVFYPLFPWTIRLVSIVLGNPLVSAVLVSTVASLVAGILLYRLVGLDHSRAVARGAVWFLFIFPTSYFLHIGYSESLFLALVLGCLWMARAEQWQAAGFLAALCCMSRGPGIAIIPTLCAEIAHQFWVTRRWRWDWLWITQAPLGFLVYLLVNYRVTGNAFTFMQVAREHFFVSLSWPWVSINQAIGALDREPAQAETVGAQVLIFMAISLVAVVVAWIRLRPMEAMWITSNWLLVAGMSFTISFPRFVLMMFPLHVLMAQLGRKAVWHWAMTVWSLLYLGLFASLFLRGHWAF